MNVHLRRQDPSPAQPFFSGLQISAAKVQSALASTWEHTWSGLEKDSCIVTGISGRDIKKQYTVAWSMLARQDLLHSNLSV